MQELDQALARFQQCQVEYGDGLTNRGPMAAQAILRLGHPALLEGLVDVYAPRLRAIAPGSVIPRKERDRLRGDPSSVPDWIATYREELEGGDWRAVLDAGVAELAPGIFAGGGGAWLRVAQAARAIADRDNPIRRRELAFGLGYWAGRYFELPGKPGSRPERAAEIEDLGGSGVGPRRLFEMLRPIAQADRISGSLVQQAEALTDDSSFAAAIATIDLAGVDASAVVDELCGALARLYLESPGVGHAYLQAFLVASAYRLVEPALSPETRLAALRSVVHAAAAIHALVAEGSVGTPTSDATERMRLAESQPELRYRAACSIQEHAIEFTEACVREYGESADRLYLEAAANAVILLDSGLY